MAIKVYKKNTAGRRNMSIVKSEDVSSKKPEKSLMAPMKSKAGRSHGKISVRHQGGGAKRRYRIVDFRQDKFGIPGKIAAIERDPNRSSFVALINYVDGEKRYILASEGMKAGMEILTAENAPIKLGNRTKVKNIPTGTTICNLELFPGKGGQIVRGAGSSAILTAAEDKTAQVKMPSGEIRLVSSDCYATIGQVSNFEHNAVNIGKAGRKRHMGVRPGVRGTVMNPVDHPHGGGEGKQGIGLKHPKTPWGKPALGKKTRKKKRYSNKFIIKRRQKRK
ncbi:MAG: 50S ribosomal protein L2 [Candidatus Moranbacteria bacterium GW2011_GWA2_39_41]|nr:MAG: 50S ribosomal protein L2 [Candidatus Moranbacteria bacterium GW2011_GWA2_39_41]